MGPDGGPDGSSYTLPELAAFRKLIASSNKRKLNETRQKFVKNMDNIPTVALPAEETCRSALNLSNRGLIGQFTGLSPSPKAVDAWVQRNWGSLVKAGIRSYSVGKGFFVFMFEEEEDISLIFRNRPYFMGPQGLYLNKWTPDFDNAICVIDCPSVGVRLPHLTLHC